MTGAAHDDLWAFMEPERPEPRDDDRWVGPPEDEAKRLRDLGAAQALDHADSRGRAAGERAIRDLATSGREFTSDDVHEMVGHPLGCSSAVMGSLILSAAKRGEIEHVAYVKSKRPSSHGREVKSWRGTGHTPEPAKAAKPKRSPSPKGDSGAVPVSAGTWTAAEVPKPCTRCGAPAFMRLDGSPRHKADCAGAMS